MEYLEYEDRLTDKQAFDIVYSFMKEAGVWGRKNNSQTNTWDLDFGIMEVLDYRVLEGVGSIIMSATLAFFCSFGGPTRWGIHTTKELFIRPTEGMTYIHNEVSGSFLKLVPAGTAKDPQPWDFRNQIQSETTKSQARCFPMNTWDNHNPQHIRRVPEKGVTKGILVDGFRSNRTSSVQNDPILQSSGRTKQWEEVTPYITPENITPKTYYAIDRISMLWIEQHIQCRNGVILRKPPTERHLYYSRVLWEIKLYFSDSKSPRDWLSNGTKASFGMPTTTYSWSICVIRRSLGMQ